MKKTTSNLLSKRLTQYGALTAAMTGISNVNGQIDYTPVNIIDAGTYQLDVDNDGTPEFKFSQFSNSLKVLPNFTSAAILGNPSPNYYGVIYPFALYSDAIISNAQTNWFYGSGKYQSMNYDNGLGGYWGNPTTDKYLGLRFDISGQTHYGWARISVYTLPGIGDYPTSGWAITGYAYEETANKSILAGDETLGIDDNSFADKVKIVALHKSIALYNLPGSTVYKLYSMTGQSVLEGKTNQNTFVIEANTQAKGIYVIEVMDNNSKAVIRKKVVL